MPNHEEQDAIYTAIHEMHEAAGKLQTQEQRDIEALVASVSRLEANTIEHVKILQRQLDALKPPMVETAELKYFDAATLTPYLGAIVIYHQGTYEDRDHGTNATRQHPAIITRVWSNDCVNLHVFFDAWPSKVKTSVCKKPILPEGVTDVGENSYWSWLEL